MANITWVDWSAVEENVPAGERTAFEQSFRQLALPADTADTPYQSSAGEGVEATLKALEQEGRVKNQDGRLLIDKKLIPDEFQKYADEEV